MLRERLLIVEIWEFLKERKIWWIIPLIITLILVGLIIISTQSSVISPVIYALF